MEASSRGTARPLPTTEEERAASGKTCPAGASGPPLAAKSSTLVAVGKPNTVRISVT